MNQQTTLWPATISHYAVRDMICNELGYTPMQVVVANKKREYSDVRHIIAKTIRKRMPQLPLVKIAECLGRDNHTTVLNSIKKCDNYCGTDGEFRKKYEAAQQIVDRTLAESISSI
jgi:chromosomal replication initiation ATPase DnaA